MRSKLALSALVIASLLGATTVVSAQTQPAPAASSEGPAATAHHMKSGKMSKSSTMKSGTTTGMSSSAHKSHKADQNKADQNNMSK